MNYLFRQGWNTLPPAFCLIPQTGTFNLPAQLLGSLRRWVPPRTDHLRHVLTALRVVGYAASDLEQTGHFLCVLILF